MKILVAEDDRVSRQILTNALVRWGYETVVTLDGAEAWAELQKPDAPAMAILDWMMPELDGVELTRRVRALKRPAPTYLMLLTARPIETASWLGWKPAPTITWPSPWTSANCG